MNYKPNISERIRFAFYLILEKFLRYVIHAKWRAQILKFFGAKIGSNVRINEIVMIGLWNGFKNLYVGNDSFIGEDCLIDLTGKVVIGERTYISPRCTVFTHQDPGTMSNSKLAVQFPRKIKDVAIGNDTWIGAVTTILCGSNIGNHVVIGAASLVNKNIQDGVLAYGHPAKVIKDIQP